MILFRIICYCQSTNKTTNYFYSIIVYLPLISSVMLNDWPRWFAIPIMHVYTCIKAYSARVNIPHVETNDKFGRAYLPPVVINSRADRNLLKWQRGPTSPPPSVSRFVISQKVTTSRATRLSSLTLLATHHTDGSRHGVMPGVIVFPTAEQ